MLQSPKITNSVADEAINIFEKRGKFRKEFGHRRKGRGLGRSPVESQEEKGFRSRFDAK